MAGKTGIEWTDALAQRFWSYVDKSGDCWNWTGGTFGGRYGQFRAGKKKVKAHRFAWLVSGNDLPDGMILCHRCDNVLCVNPSHLFVGTHADNSADREAKGRHPHTNKPVLSGELNPSARLTRANVDSIRERLARGEKQKHLASEFMVAPTTISAISRGVIWQTTNQA